MIIVTPNFSPSHPMLVQVSTTTHEPEKFSGASAPPDRDDTAADDTDVPTSTTDPPATTSHNPNRRIRLSFSTPEREWHQSTQTVQNTPPSTSRAER